MDIVIGLVLIVITYLNFVDAVIDHRHPFTVVFAFLLLLASAVITLLAILIN